MGWRDELLHVIGPNVSSDLYDEGVFVDYDTIGNDLLAMPPAIRIALARELLAGTGRVVAMEVAAPEPRYERHVVWCHGYNTCRAAMMEDDDPTASPARATSGQSS